MTEMNNKPLYLPITNSDNIGKIEKDIISDLSKVVCCLLMTTGLVIVINYIYYHPSILE